MIFAINVLERIMPAAAKLGTKTLVEVIGAASIGAGVVNFALDKGTALAKEKLDGKLEAKKQELLEKRAVALEKKAAKALEQVEAKDVQEVKTEVAEEKPTKGSKKNK